MPWQPTHVTLAAAIMMHQTVPDALSPIASPMSTIRVQGTPDLVALQQRWTQRCCVWRRRVGQDINPLLTRRAKESLHHLPLFSAVMHGYPAIIRLLLQAGLDMEHGACMEHFEVPGLCCIRGVPACSPVSPFVQHPGG